MKIIIPHASKPLSLDLSALELGPDFRSDLLFFIRLAGTYAQTIFWQAFPRSAMARRKKMFNLAKQVIPENKAVFRAAVLDPQKRHSKTTDLFHKGFLSLLAQIGQDPTAQKIFTDGLKQEHGIFWRFDELLEFLEALMEKRHYLEHYEERRKKNLSFDNRMNLKAMEALGVLLLPELCNMLEMSAKAVKGKSARSVADDIHTLLAWCKQERSKSIQLMFSEERKRSKLDKRRRKSLAPDADNAQVWLKSYYTLGISPTDYRLFQFKRRYDFIGQQNLRLLFRALGAPLQQKSRALIYESSPTAKLSFRYDVEALYLLAVRIGAVIHRFLDYAPKDNKGKFSDPTLKAIRDSLAHNGLFWDIRMPNNQPLSAEEVFQAVMAPLPMGLRSQFCDRMEVLLRRENHAVLHSVMDGHPKTEKIRRWTDDRRVAAKQSSDITVSHRRSIRKVAARWMRALQQAGQTHGLKMAGKNAI